MKVLLLLLSLAFLHPPLKAQLQSTNLKTKAESKNLDTTLAIQKYYQLAIRYKEGYGVPMDYQKACNYFQKAANLGDSQSVYAIGYMHYKGLGCNQDYALAARLFKQGAYGGRDNSMYFYGLCWRNGYGLAQNEDSAQYWLKKSAATGYKQAQLELQSKVSENSNIEAKKLAQKIHNAAVPKQVTLNQFVLIKPVAPDSSLITGEYQGYLIQYDWSGKNLISAKPLRLKLSAFPDHSKREIKISGKWVEKETDSIVFNASLQNDSLVFFKDTHYKRNDHYSFNNPIAYDFENASLNMVRKGDTVFLAGNINMFSPDRKEPSKPLFVAVKRSLINEKNQDNPNEPVASIINVYPNPFQSLLNVDFRISEKTKISIELYNIDGTLVFRKKSGNILSPGSYTIKFNIPNYIPSQTYILRLIFSNGEQSFKVIKG